MPNKNNIWYKIFNHSSTERESWLDPSNAVFEGIENEIYPKKKKRRFVLFRFLAMALLLMSAAIYFYKVPQINTKTISNLESELKSGTKNISEQFNSESKKSQELSKENIKQILESADLHSESHEDQKSGTKNTLNSASVGASDNTSNSTKIYNSEKPLTNIEAEKKVASISKHIQLAKNKINSTKSTQKVAEVTHSGFIETPISTSQTNSISDLSTTESHEASGQNDMSPNEIIDPLQIQFLETLDIALLKRPLLTQTLSFVTPSFNLENNALASASDFEKEWSLSLGSGLSYWNFNLNTNYQTALDPADFTYDNGNAYTFFINIERDLCENFSISLNTMFENVSFKSGHNSNVPFDNSMTVNEVELTMASPIGFLRSRVDITNDNQVPTTGSTDLVLDLHNSHKIINWDFTLNLNYNIYRKNGIDIDLIGGGGLSYISAFSNNLDSFVADNSNFKSGQSSIIGDQENLNVTRFHNVLGLSLNKDCSYLGGRFGLNLLYKADFKPLYSVDDFSTSLNKFNVGLFYQVRF